MLQVRSPVPFPRLKGSNSISFRHPNLTEVSLGTENLEWDTELFDDVLLIETDINRFRSLSHFYD